MVQGPSLEWIVQHGILYQYWIHLCCYQAFYVFWFFKLFKLPDACFIPLALSDACAMGAECWFQFPNDAAYVLPNYVHYCTALLGFFTFFHCKSLYEKIKSCNSEQGLCRLHQEFNSGTKGLT
jgi:hypothetical protein